MNDVAPALCFEETVPSLFNISHVPELILYSHLPAASIALLLAVFLVTRGGLKLPNIILSTSLAFFAYWVFANVLIWGTNRSDIIMFHWSLQILFEPLVYIGMLYLFWVYITKKNVSLKTAILVFLAYLPLIVITPTNYSLSGFNLTECVPDEAVYSYYTYILEILCILGIVILSITKYRSLQDKNKKKEILYLTVGTLFFLLAFQSGNVFGSYTGEWIKSQFGLFGMPVFACFLAFLIVRYQAFNLKLIGVQMLVSALIVLVGSQLFFIQSFTNFILTSITLALVFGAGWFLIREVKKEVKRKEELEILSQELAVANTELKRLDASKSEFISIASHQLRTPLTAIRGFLDLLLEGAYGKLEPRIAETLNKVVIANNRLMGLVENLLNITRIEAGRIQYQFAPTHIEDIVDELDDMFFLAAKDKGISLKIERPSKPLHLLSLDANKIREVISNLIDNALKYTPAGGSVTVSFEEHPECVAVVVEDTGMGIDPKDLPHLFKKFERGSQAERVNVSSTGLGLFVSRKFSEAHGGTIEAYSAGKGKGAKFVLELPIHVAEKVKQLSVR